MVRSRPLHNDTQSGWKHEGSYNTSILAGYPDDEDVIREVGFQTERLEGRALQPVRKGCP